MRRVERNEVDPGSPGLVRSLDGLGGGGAGRFKRKHPPPGIGDRRGMLVVSGYLVPDGGGLQAVVVQCDCGRPEHRVAPYTFQAGRSTRCNACAKEATRSTRQKHYLHYAGACPDVEHRTRLLNRISAIHTRCTNPRSRQWAAYGGRGIRCWWSDVYGDERFGTRSRTGKLQTMRWRYEMLRYLVSLPGWDNPELEIDRIDNDRGYEPGNLRFSTRSDNSRNKRQVDLLSARIVELEAELSRLRSAELRSEQPLHGVLG